MQGRLLTIVNNMQHPLELIIRSGNFQPLVGSDIPRTHSGNIRIYRSRMIRVEEPRIDMAQLYALAVNGAVSIKSATVYAVGYEPIIIPEDVDPPVDPPVDPDANTEFGTEPNGTEPDDADLPILSEHLNNFMITSLTDQDPAVATPFFSSIYHGDTTPTGDYRGYTYQAMESSTYVRNENLWINGLSGINSMSVYNWKPTSVIGTTARHGIMVTPRHIVTSNHSMLGVGFRVRFVRSDNTPVEYILTDYVGNESMGSAGPVGGSDISVGQFGEDLPDDIGFVKILPPDTYDYIQTPVNSQPINDERMPIVGIMGGSAEYRDKHAAVKKCYHPWYLGTITLSPMPSASTGTIQESGDPLYDAFYLGLPISGNSGAPILVPIDNELILFSTWTTNYGGPRYAYYINAINDAIASMGSDYRLTIANLSRFRRFR